jgi:NAD(P)H-flavin reductase
LPFAPSRPDIEPPDRRGGGDRGLRRNFADPASDIRSNALPVSTRRDALRHGHTGPIRLYHGALEQNGLYLTDELHAMQALHSNFSYNACVLSGEPEGKIRIGPIDQVVFQDHPKLNGQRVYLCGDPTLVNALRKKVFLAGAAMKEISADAFLTRSAS